MSETNRIIEVQLPFDQNQNEIVISQGFDGPYSHNRFSVRTCQYDLRHALDFALPLGTVVQAARQGIVRYLINGNGHYTGSDPKEGRKSVAASAIIAHPDISGFPGVVYSHYQHLDPESFKVEVGDQVECGQPLAKTGMTGWTGEIPHLHLHFQYHKINKGQGPCVTSVPFGFTDFDGNLEDEECIKNIVGDSRELARKILSIRTRDGFFPQSRR